jgi:uncharacterized protein (DUF58 family)
MAATRELLKRIRKLEISTQKVVSETLAGQYHSVFKGRGMAFSEVRPYGPGDEIRSIDWNVTARMNEAFVKVFNEERELTAMLLVDVSASKDFGSGERFKSEVAAEAAAQIAFSAIANNDRVGLILFSDRVEKVIPPKKGRAHVMRLVTDVLAFRPDGRGTDLAVGLSYLNRWVKRRAVVFLISDFQADGYEPSLKLVARKHDLVPLVVSDPLERELPPFGLIALQDPETGRRLVVDAGHPQVRAALQESVDAERRKREQLFRRLELDHAELGTGSDHGLALAQFFQRRARRLSA